MLKRYDNSWFRLHTDEMPKGDRYKKKKKKVVILILTMTVHMERNPRFPPSFLFIIFFSSFSSVGIFSTGTFSIFNISSSSGDRGPFPTATLQFPVKAGVSSRPRKAGHNPWLTTGTQQHCWVDRGLGVRETAHPSPLRQGLELWISRLWAERANHYTTEYPLNSCPVVQTVTSWS